MDRKVLLEDKVKKTMNVMSQEMKVARDYGVGFPLYHSEVHLLDAINAHEGANACELANSRTRELTRRDKRCCDSSCGKIREQATLESVVFLVFIK
jgi:hypothetical protein